MLFCSIYDSSIEFRFDFGWFRFISSRSGYSSNRLLEFGGKKFKIEIDSSIRREEIQKLVKSKKEEHAWKRPSRQLCCREWVAMTRFEI